MLIESAYNQLRALTLEGLEAIEQSEFSVAGCKNSIAFFDSKKDELITNCPSFSIALESVSKISEVVERYGSTEALRLVLQFVFNACSMYATIGDKSTAFKETFKYFKTEAETDHWVYRAIANVQNFENPSLPIELADGITLRGRSFTELEHLLHWGSSELAHLTADWRDGGGGSNVLMVESRVNKSPSNFLLVNDVQQMNKVARMLLAMRLALPGDIRIGRMFAARPTAFNVGIGGLQSYGRSYWHLGSPYKLELADIPKINSVYNNLTSLELQQPKSNRNLRLALRSFSAIYDRQMHQADDRLVDAITALEALWKLEAELTFRLSFRTSSLLASSDDERLALFSKLTDYYKIRSKIVHGGGLNDVQEAALHEDEPLRKIVRCCLRGFLHLAIHPGEWTLARLEKEADTALMHGLQRMSLRKAMQL
jgi:Apea-like HEPN